MRWITLFLTGLVLIGVALDARDHPTPASADPYHRRIVDLATEAARKLGLKPGWMVTKQKVPQEAQKLLKPNVVEAWRCSNEQQGVRASVIMVQTRDAGDMGGHYPPVCYPAHGWIDVSEKGASRVVDVRGIKIPTEVYLFRQGRAEDERRIKIYNFFVIPGAGAVPSMQAVRRASEDYRVRPFGAAQFQVMVDATMSEDLIDVVFQDLVGELLPLITALGAPTAQTGGDGV